MPDLPPEAEEPGVEPLRVGVSACLLGQKVRYDGGHKRDRFINDTLSRWVEFVPVCPELELGLGVPRPTIRLEKRAGEVALVEPRSGVDLTRRMTAFSRQRVRALRDERLCGYVLKNRSPSCGMERVQVWNEAGMPEKTGRGLYAQALMAANPELPVEEEGRLCDPRLRENFVERLFAYRRVRGLFAGRWKLADLVAFHTVHKLQLMAHSPRHYREMGRLVAGAKALPRKEVQARYQAAFMAALTRVATPGRNTNVLQHMAGYFKKTLDDACKQELGGLIEDYRRGWSPLVVPLTLIRHHAHRLGVDYLKGQTYLEPHPKELMLRNHV